MAKVPGIGRNIGKIQDNKIKDKEFAQRILGLCLEARKLGKLGKPKTVQEMEDRIDDYLGKCFEAGLPPTVEGMAMSIDYDRTTVYQIEHEMANVKFSNVVKRAKDFIANYDASLGMSNKLNAAIYCFRAKNMYGMKDVQEIKATAGYNTDPANPEAVVESLPDINNSEDYIEIKNEA